MTETRKFDEQTHWDHDPGGLRAGGAGWAPPGADFFIDRADPYWGTVLAKARTAYGDPNMRFNTDDVGRERRLVFGDGTSVPADGSLAYRDAATHRTYLLNTDGTVSPLGTNNAPGRPVSPAGFRRTDTDSYAPVDPAGHQIAPLAASPPTAPYGYHDAHGVLTPNNARGDYYVDYPGTGKRGFFDKDGHPITAAQFDDKTTKDPQDAGIPTDEQQSGRAADAVRQLHQELAHRYSQISDADATLSEVLLNAHATTTDGQQKLQAIQHTIIAAINDPAMSLDTPAGQQAFLKFLRSQVTAIGDIVTSGSLAADDQAKALEALADLYPPATDPPPSADTDTSPAASPTDAAPAEPDRVTTAPLDAGLGPQEPMPDPSLSDLGLGVASTPASADALASLASALPAALGALPTGGLGAGLDPLSSLSGAAVPLAGLMPQLADQPRRDKPPDDHADEATPAEAGESDSPKHADTQANSPSPASQPQPPSPGTPVDSSASAAPAASPPPDTSPTPTTTIALPDGSTGTARTAALAQAVKSYLGGTPVDAAYRDAGLTLPPPGTPVTAPIDPSTLTCGAIGMFKDHYVVAVDPAKALDNGQVVPLTTVASGPGFLGWLDPAASTTPATARTAPASSGDGTS
jgi:Domain of unknown function (DUF4226)